MKSVSCIVLGLMPFCLAAPVPNERSMTSINARSEAEIPTDALNSLGGGGFKRAEAEIPTDALNFLGGGGFKRAEAEIPTDALNSLGGGGFKRSEAETPDSAPESFAY
ncbi:hypothetical protein N7527_005913 [Penicillium freii]|uniref:Uncharacterized protein n=1 Tax=Penicillium freii TaxID=48697 RepID=A0A101MJI9_PENFR|nr:hypothetical protein N7527_005913 [Penicillium freii]KUM61648.1 hypothetical protein ACN42_g5468 [Penicillium freii]